MIEGAVTRNAGIADPQCWYATTSSGADFRSHRLASSPPRGDWGAIAALCGERRREWLPVEQFARPERFHPCTTCQSLAGDPV